MTSASTPPVRSIPSAIRRRRCRPGTPGSVRVRPLRRPRRRRAGPCRWPGRRVRVPSPPVRSRCSPMRLRWAVGRRRGTPPSRPHHPDPTGDAARTVAARPRPGYGPPPGPPPARSGPAAGDGPRRPSGSGGGGRRWPRRLVWSLVALLGLGLLAPVVAFLVGWVMFDVPSANQTEVTQVATFKYADGAALATIRPDNVNRTIVTLNQVPEHVRHAVLSAEDRSFYSNPGFDLTGIGRALWNQATGGVGGGSTITQQYVKVSTGQDSASLWRKYKEIVLAVKISQEQTKDQILENYLNVIYLGRGAYGIQAASQAYFGKDVKDLSVAEGAMLAGTIQSPSRWDPAKNPEKSNERWNFVLDGMVAQGWLPAADRAQEKFPAFLPEAPQGGGIPGDAGGHVYKLAMDELAARGITDQEINTEGLTIDLTIDSKRQEQAVAAVDEGAQGPAGEPAGCAGVGRPQDRGDPGLLRRVQRRGRRLRAGPAPARVVVQAVRAVRGAAGLPPGGRAREHLRRVVAAELPRRPGEQLRRLQLQPVHGAAGDDQVGQHRLLQDGHRRRPAARGRRRAPGRDPVGRAAHPHGGHRAGRQGGPPDRHGVGVRDVRGRRNPPRRLRGVEGDGGRRPGDLRPRHGDRAAGRAAAGRPQRHRGDDRRGVLRRDRPRRPGGRRQDRHRAAPDAERAEQGRLDGRLHPVGVDRRLGRNRPERSDQELRRAPRVRADAARLDLADVHDRCAARHPGRAVLALRRPRHPAGHRHGRVDGRHRRELRRELRRRGQGQEEVRQRQQRLGSRVGRLERLGQLGGSRSSDSESDSGSGSGSGGSGSDDSSDEGAAFQEPRFTVPGLRNSQPVRQTSGQQPLAAGTPTAG